jgi:hypothetical protein
MPDINPNQRVYDVMLNVKDRAYLIPNIQRGYEWDQARLLKLLDSIMSGYPIGAIMVWQPMGDIQADIPTRQFVQDFESTQDYLTQPPHAANKNANLVLDGQQRLQSLYISFFGSYDKKRVYLDVTLIPTEEDGDTDYGFEFIEPGEAREKPEMVPLDALINLDIDDEYKFVEDLVTHLTGSITEKEEREKRQAELRNNINNNIRRFKNRFNEKQILLFQEVDKKHNYDHVLEIFERVNSAGMVLTKSDLMFSTLKLKLKEMEQSFADTLDFVNQGSRFDFNTDFLIKSCLVIFDQNARYEVKKLRKDDFVKNVKDHFPELSYCFRHTIAWLDDIARIKCDRFLRSRLALIPIMDYMMLSGNHDKPGGANAEDMKQYLYMAFFMRLFARTADSILDKLHSIMKKQVKKGMDDFPIQSLRDFMTERLKVPYQLQPHHFQYDADLMLNIVDGGVLQIDPEDESRHPKDLRLEVDHIFPKTPLSNQGMGDIVNHIGNYRLVVRPINRRKGPQMPDQLTPFWGRDNSDIEPAYQAAIKHFSRNRFLEFRDKRARGIQASVERFLNLKIAP